jgi:hypothetical protein
VQNATYGRAAKVISIYLKTSVILCNQAKCKKSQVIHPPLDSILLARIAHCLELPSIKTKRWTLFNENDYWDMVKTLQARIGKFDWRVEFYWKPERD